MHFPTGIVLGRVLVIFRSNWVDGNASVGGGMVMSEQNSYDTLGLDESSSFDEIQAARSRLLEECAGDRPQMDSIEAAYDAILMERLRLRQEGKIKVPDRIRFAEDVPEAPAPTPQSSGGSQMLWVQQLLDTPTRDEVLVRAGVYGLLAVIGAIAAPSLALAVGVGCTLYFLNRKEYRFWRALLLTIAGLTLGLTLGLIVGQGLATQGLQLPGGSPEGVVQGVAAGVTLFVFWAISSFLR